jgi:hypothetical protein
MLLNELTWPAPYSNKGVIDGITTDPVPPAHIITGDGLSKTRKSMTKSPRRWEGQTNLQCRSHKEIPLTVTTTPFDWFAKGSAVCLKVIESPLVP